jgi:hypothetical protein
MGVPPACLWTSPHGRDARATISGATTKGAEITKRNISRARYDGNYRITGNFLNWVTGKYDRDIVRKLNAAAREGKYNEELWKNYTGKTVQELGDEWKKVMEDKLEDQ